MNPLPPRAELYLDELGRLLAPAEPVDRIEILAGVREHLETSLADLGATASDADVAAVLRQLGSPDAVARQAVGDAPIPATAPPPLAYAPPPTVPLVARGWVVPVVVVLLGLALLAAALLARGMAARYAVSPVDATGEGSIALGPLLPDGVPVVTSLVYAVVAVAGPLWLPAVVLLWVSPRWRPGWKAIGTLTPLLPVLGASASLLVEPLGLPGLVAGVLGGIAVLVVLVRTAAPGPETRGPDARPTPWTAPPTG